MSPQPHVIWSFLRHGQSVANEERWLAGYRDTPLTPLGVAQAEAVRGDVRRLPIDLVLVSDLERARRTAEIALHGREVPVHQTAALRERNGGDLEGQSIDALRDSGALARLSEWQTRPPGGESLADVAQRAIACLAEHDRAHDVLVVAHGALIRAVLHVLDQGAQAEVGAWSPANCELATRRLRVGTLTQLRLVLAAGTVTE